MIAIVGDKGVGKHQLIEKMLDVEAKVNDKDIMSIDFFISYIWIGDCQYQTIHYWVVSLDSKQQLTTIPFIPHSDIYVIMFDLNDHKSLHNALQIWFLLCSKKRKAQYIFLGSDDGGQRKCGSYHDIIKIIRNKMIRSSPNLEEVQCDSPQKEMRKTIAYTEEFIEDQLPEDVQYIEIKENNHQPFKGILIQQIQNVISNERQSMFSLSAPISPNMMPQLKKSISEFAVHKVETQESSFGRSKTIAEKKTKDDDVVKTIQLDYSQQMQPIQSAMSPYINSLEQSGYQQQAKQQTEFCCQLI